MFKNVESTYACKSSLFANKYFLHMLHCNRYWQWSNEYEEQNSSKMKVQIENPENWNFLHVLSHRRLALKTAKPVCLKVGQTKLLAIQLNLHDVVNTEKKKTFFLL